MTKALSPNPVVQFLDNAGAPLAGGCLYTYAAGRPGVYKATYPSATSATPNTNPVVLDSAGRASVFIDGYYYMELYTAPRETPGATLVWSQDNVSNQGGFAVGNFGTIDTNGYTTAMVFVDATVSPTVTLPEGGVLVVMKTDHSPTPVEILPAVGWSFADGTLSVQLSVTGEAITFKADGNKYYTVRGGQIVPYTTVTVLPISPTGAALFTVSTNGYEDLTMTWDAENTEVIFKRSDPTPFRVILEPPGGYTIDGGLTQYVLSVDQEWVHMKVAPFSTNYQIIGR